MIGDYLCNECRDHQSQLLRLLDGMGINYGVGGMGAMVVARNRKVGPVKDCPECRAESRADGATEQVAK